MKPRARLPIMIVALLAGCGDPPREAPRPSEPTDAFFPRDPARKGAYPPTIYHRRDPSRAFTTRLRPTDLEGGFPTAYLRDITHFDQPYAKTIWDKVTAGLSLKDLTPLPVENTTRWRRDIAADDLLLEIGGYSSSRTDTPAVWAGLVHGTVGRRDGINVVDDRGLTFYFFDDDLAGRPGNHHVISCYSICSGRLTVPMNAAGRPALSTPLNENAVSGLGVELTFHASRITQWTDIKTVALCFLSDAVPDLDPRRLPGARSRRCTALRAAIRRQAGVGGRQGSS